MKKSNIKDLNVIFFDVDGTLYDQKTSHKRTLQKVIKRYSEVFSCVSEEELLNAFEIADKECYQEFINGVPLDEIRRKRSLHTLKLIGVDEAFSERFHDEFYRIYPSIKAEIKGAGRVIDYLDPKYQLGILTNSSKDIQLTKLRNLDMLKHFDELVFSEEVGSRKPDKEIFLDALSRVNDKPENCLYLGDSFTTDIIGAEKVGMRTCWLNPDGEKRPANIEPDLEISELSELLDIL